MNRVEGTSPRLKRRFTSGLRDAPGLDTSGRLTSVTSRTFRTFHEQRRPGAPRWLKEIREAAIARFAELGFPSMKQEEWRFTSTAPIAETPFALSHRHPNVALTSAEVDAVRSTGARAARVVFVDGAFAPELSAVGELPPGVHAGSLAGAQEYAAMAKLQEFDKTGDYDLIIVDTPPTSNALDFLDAPQKLTQALDSPAVEWFRKMQVGSKSGWSVLGRTGAPA